MNPSSVEVSREQLIENFFKVVADAEALMHATADQGSDEIAAIRDSMQETLKAARLRLDDARDDVLRKGRAAAQTTDSFVHDNPWSAVAVAAGLGLLVGLFGWRR